MAQANGLLPPSEGAPLPYFQGGYGTSGMLLPFPLFLHLLASFPLWPNGKHIKFTILTATFTKAPGELELSIL